MTDRKKFKVDRLDAYDFSSFSYVKNIAIWIMNENDKKHISQN